MKFARDQRESSGGARRGPGYAAGTGVRLGSACGPWAGTRPAGRDPDYPSRVVPLPGDSRSVSSWISAPSFASASRCCRL